MPYLPDDRPESCTARILSGTGVGYGLGTVLGAITANWSDLPMVLRDKPWPALVRTGKQLLPCRPATIVGLTQGSLLSELTTGHRACGCQLHVQLDSNALQVIGPSCLDCQILKAAFVVC